MAATPVLFIGLFMLAVLPNQRSLSPEDIEVIGLLNVLRTDVPPNSPLSRPEIRIALETYLAGQRGAVLRDNSLWGSPMTPNADLLGRMASDIAARYPSVTPEELARSRQTIQPLVGPLLLPQLVVTRSQGLIVANIVLAGTAVLALLFSIVSSLAVPGGAATRMIGLAVVTRDGNEIGRGRALARTLIAWLPILAWLVILPGLASLAASKRNVPLTPIALLTIALPLGAMIAGVVWTIAAADRGLHDRIARTWVVPR
jgi:uncharacterized RDD family membrane protein YckC